ncbi:MAG: hypothetical protein QM765_47585 [Myxococcales bacterium]
MPRLSSLVAVVLAVLAAFPAHGATPASKKKVAVLEVQTLGTFDPKAVQGLSMVVVSEAEKAPLKVVAGTDLSALIGFERQKQMLGCTESSCLSEVGGALGVEYLLSTQVSEVGGVWLLTTTLLDVLRSVSLKRVSLKTEQVRSLVDLAQQATREALAALPGSNPAPAAPPAISVSNPASPSSMSGTRVAGIALAVAGGAALAGGGVCGVLALGQFDEAKRAATDQSFQDAKRSGGTVALAADVLYGVGAAAAVTGIILAVLGGTSHATPAVTFAPSAAPGGAGLVASGSF